MKYLLYIIVIITMNVWRSEAQTATSASYLDPVKAELKKQWPDNKTINIVFHGHSVPSGYFKTPVVNTLNAYPHLVFHQVKEIYPCAVVNVITTSIGGEHSEGGAARFEKEVLTHHPDVLFIDYALNDRTIGLERSEKAWRKMIECAISQQIKVILLTPTPDTIENITDPKAPLSLYTTMIKNLAKEYHVGLVDSYDCFRNLAAEGKDIKCYMSQSNHLNEKGHYIVADEIINYFR